ncbi:hypothetical protein [Streptomyces sp. NPDC056105]|uniref:hypothetical protein n=1 Tax=Streptomyces sp. NPDC056105 TaxID=3345714 RepID=UPI0035D89C3E
MQNMSRAELLRLLDDIKARVASGDSHEGKLHYRLDTDAERPFRVAAMYRVDGTLGTGRTEMVGVEVAVIRCPKCSNEAGPFDLKTGLCDDCTEAAA